MLNRLIFCILFFLSVTSFAQDCKLSISGKIIDADAGSAIAFANIYIEKLLKGTTSSDSGSFQINNICKGDYHLIVSHIGCETQEFFIQLKKDTFLTIELDHNHHLLHEVTVKGEKGSQTIQEKESISEKDISENAGKNLSEMLESISGVSTLKTGSGIGKPVVQGLSGNRLTILNNGISQSGQQWGSDHSPEIDPLSAKKITVVKGVGVIEYMGNNLGNAILVEPTAIKNDPHLHGKANYFFESNGFGNGLNVELEKFSKAFAWRFNGTIKKRGDTKTPNYYLTNSGLEEANFSLQLERKISDQLSTELYLSSFNSRIGILRGSHIGNLTDLEIALQREEPFFTADDFSYEINSPRQTVQHELLKSKLIYQPNLANKLELIYGGQLNQRKEFDVRRGENRDKPSLSLEQLTHFFEVKYKHFFTEYLTVKSGFQFRDIDNENLPETNILPLIPNYISKTTGGFVAFNYNKEKLGLEIGGRVDDEIRNIAAITTTTPREVIRYKNNFQNSAYVFGANYEIAKNLLATYNIGIASRIPQVNELYSNGLHQGVSGIELGDPSLERENSFKNSLSIQGKAKEKISFKALMYYQQVDDFIYLKPQDEFRLTIRGAFPLFKYEQTNAELFGFDLATNYQFSDYVTTSIKYSYLRGKDTDSDLPLVNIPANNLFAEVDYKIPTFRSLENAEIQLNSRYVFEREEELAEIDFVAPPVAYFLMGFKVSAEKQLSKVRLTLYVRVDNLLNTTYRDYLNRQRYFADELGRNVSLGVIGKF